MLLPPPLLPPQEPEGEELQAPPPENFWGGEGQDAGVPQQPLFMLLKAARRAQPQPPQRREPAPPGAEELELPLPPPPPGAEELELPLPPPPPGAEELELPLLPPLPGAEELELPLPPVLPLQGVRWPEPQKGELPGHEEGGGRGTTCPRSFFAAGRDEHAVGRATTGRGADSIASHGPTEASLPSPRLCPALLGF
ncbi:UNVERIFIED_CONTAM: hypothetical protein FKN15_054916 [Acipenser sinensis]